MQPRLIRAKEQIKDILRKDFALRRELQRELAVTLMELVHDDYIHKSKGGVGADGVKWKRTKTGHPIMIDTGRLLDSLEVKDMPDGNVGVHFRIFPPTNDADEGRLIAALERPIWPLTIPKEWMEVLSQKIAEFMKRAIRQRLQKARVE